MDRQGGFLEGEVVPVYQPGEGGPRIDPSNRAIQKIKELTEADFPETDLVIDSNGLIRRKGEALSLN